MEAHGSKKRKMVDTDNEEDEKVEEFFALIRSTREARDRLRSIDHDDKLDHRHKAITINRKESCVWNPTFRPEDFLDRDHDHHHDHKDRDHKPCLGGTSTGQSPPSKLEVENVKLVKGEKVSASNNSNDTNNNNNNNNSLDLKLSL